MLTHTLPQSYLPSMSPDVIHSLTQQSVVNGMPHVTLNLKEPPSAWWNTPRRVSGLCVSDMCVSVVGC